MRHTVLLVLLLAAALPSQAQLTGLVLDAHSSSPLAGVHVYAPGTTLGTITDSNGRFRLQEAGLIVTELTASFIGFRAATVTVPETRDSDIVIHLEPAAVDLQPVIVSASRGLQARSEAPVAISAIDAAKLEEDKPSMLYQALNQVPGVLMTNLGAEQHTMAIRQPIQYKALFVYLEDGLPIRPIGVFNHNALIEINMAAVSRIEVLKGPSSALYGSNAVGGAVNFITPTPTPNLSGSVTARLDNYGYRRTDFTASNTVGKLGLFAAGYYSRQRDGWADQTDFDKLSVTLRADYPLSDKTSLSTTLTTNQLDTDTRGSLDSTNFFGSGYSSLHTFTYRKVDATRVTSSLTHNWTGSQSSNLIVGYRSNAVGQLPHYRVRNNFSNPSQATGEINEDSFSSWVALAQHRAFFEPWNAALTAGLSADFSPNSFFARFLDIQRDTDGRYVTYTDPDSLLTNYDVNLLNTAAYAQVELEPHPRMRVVGALRYDRIDYDYDNHLPSSAFSGAPDEQNGFNALSPKLGVTYDFGRGRGAYANVSGGFIPPEVGELYRGVKVPTLKPATFTSREVGGWAALMGGKVYVDVSVYRMDGSNEIISVQQDDGSSENRNAGKTRHQGIEYALTFQPIQELSFRLGGTNAQHTFVRYEDGGVSFDGNEMDGAPDWIANAAVTWRPTFAPGARIGLEWQHLGRYFLDAANTGRYGGYDLIFVRAGYEAGPVEVWANIENLTDELFANVASRSRWGDSYNPGAARNAVFGIGYNF